MRHLHMSLAALGLLAFLAITNPVAAQTSGNASPGSGGPSASAIMESVYNRPKPSDTTALLTMTMVDSKNRERVRSLKQLSASFGTADKKIMEFQSPADVRGTSFMNWSYVDTGRSDDQWIYLPALKRVKRISSGGKGDSFMGSDFSYDDLGERHPDKDEHRIIGNDKIGGEECWVIESKPRDSSYSYSRTVSWISKTAPIGFRRDYYDKRDQLLKTLVIQQTQVIDGFLMITQTEMHNVQNDHRTKMSFTSLEVNKGIREELFAERTMTKGL